MRCPVGKVGMRRSGSDVQGGFTLLELTLVMAIIALLLGSVMNGGKVVEEGKIKRIALDVAQVRNAVHTYEELFLALPGDDAGAAARWPGAANGNGDGRVDGFWYPRQPESDESALFWSHLRHAGLIVGTGGQRTLPTHVSGGLVGVGDGMMGLRGLTLCMGALSAEFARSYDIQFDDGLGGSGRIRGVATDSSANAALGYPLEGPVTACEVI